MPARLLVQLGRHARPILAGGVFAGLLLPDLAAVLYPLIGPVIVLSLVLSILRIDWPMLAAWTRRPVPAGAVVLWMLLAAPALTWVVAKVAGVQAGLLVPLVLGAAAPPISSAPGFAVLLRLDASLVLVVVVATTLLLPLTLGPVAFWLMDLELTIGAGSFALRILLYIVLPFVIAISVRRMAGAERIAARAPEINGGMVTMLLIFAIAIMDGVTARLFESPDTVLVFIAAAFAINLAQQALGAAAFCWLGRRAALSVGLASGYRNMGLMLVLTAGVAGPDMALFVAMAQLPMYIMPALLHPVYRLALAGEAP